MNEMFCGNRFLFIPQNQSHLDNMVPVADEIINRGGDVLFLSVEAFVNQKIFGSNFKYNIYRENVNATMNFYRSSMLARLLSVFVFKRSISKLSEDHFDCMIVCNDGALQRAVFSLSISAKRVLILDGIITDYSINFRHVLNEKKLSTFIEYVKKKAYPIWEKVFRKIPVGLNCYLPSVIGGSKLDLIFSVSEYVRSYMLIERSIHCPHIVAGLPRYSGLEYIRSNMAVGSSKVILFVSQGFIWHNEYENDALQHEELKSLINLLSGTDFSVKVRIHPRDDIENYLDYGVEIETSEVSMYESLCKVECVVGLTSTMLLEASFIGKKVGFLRLTGLSNRLSNTILDFDDFLKIYDESSLCSFLDIKSIKGINNLEYYFLPYKPTTISNIVDSIDAVL